MISESYCIKLVISETLYDRICKKHKNRFWHPYEMSHYKNPSIWQGHSLLWAFRLMFWFCTNLQNFPSVAYSIFRFLLICQEKTLIWMYNIVFLFYVPTSLLGVEYQSSSQRPVFVALSNAGFFHWHFIHLQKNVYVECSLFPSVRLDFCMPCELVSN